MRICFLTLAHWSHTIGGAEIQTKYIVDYVRQHTSHKLYYVCRRTNTLNDDGIPVRKVEPMTWLSKYLKSADFISLQRILTEVSPDVIYTRVWSPYVGVAARYCAKHSARLVYHIAATDDITPLPIHFSRRSIRRRLDRPLFEYGLRNADAIIAQAQYQATLLMKHYGLKCAATVPNVHPVPENPEKSDACINVAWVGSIKAIKQPEIFVSLAQRFSHNPAFRFLMIAGPTERAYEDRLHEWKNLPNLRIEREVPVDCVHAELARSHIYVHTGITEGFANSIIEAWLNAASVVSLNFNPDRIFDDGTVGIYCGGSFSRLYESVRSLANNRGTMRRIAKRGREYAIDKHGIQNCKEILKLLELNS